MTATVHWTPQAESDLAEITVYIGVHSGRPTVAEHVIDAIVRKAEQYARQPEMGTILPELELPLRVFRHKRYVAIYRPTDSGIQVLRVVDGTRDFRSIL